MNTASHFQKQRQKVALALWPFLIWFLFCLLKLAGESYASAIAHFKNPFHTLMGAGFSALFMRHAYMELKVIIEDYMRPPLRQKLINVLKYKLLFVTVLTVFCLIYILVMV